MIEAAKTTAGPRPRFEMRTWLARLLLVLLPLAGAAHAGALPPLLAAGELAARSNNGALRVIDIRADGNAQYVPGAVAAPYADWRGPADNPGRLPDPPALSALLQRLGIDDSTPVVVVYEGDDPTDFGAAARVYWTLKTAGVGQVAILNGGMKSWLAAGLPTAAAPSVPTPSTYQVRIDERWLASRAQVAAASGGSSSQLLDARPAAFFLGEKKHPAARVPGTLAGARNVEHTVWFVPGTAQLASPQAIGATAQRLGVDAGLPTVSFCNTGHWAATQWFVLSEVLGGRDVRLYPESMVDWSRSGHEMANVPTRLQQFRMQLRAAFGGG
jgi:thiosulfate/3-mercaptopyruvate sulfurtransferase